MTAWIRVKADTSKAHDMERSRDQTSRLAILKPCLAPKVTKDGFSSPSSGCKGSSFDFEKYRSSVILKKDEIWAVRDEYGMPRRFVLIEKDGDIRSASFRFLKHNITINSIKQSVCGALYTCGTYIIDYGPEPLEPTIFSHKVVGWGKDNSSKYTIYPRKGEVWAIRTTDKTSLFGDHSLTLCTYEIVQVLEDYNFGKNTQVKTLVWLKGGSQNLFGRPPAKDAANLRYRPKPLFDFQLNNFSHQVPYNRVSNERSVGDCFELDFSSLPLYIDDFQCVIDPEINDNYLCLGILDRKACRYCDNGFIWAAYDRQHGMPLKYVAALPRKVDSKTKVMMHEMVPIPTTKAEKRWLEAGLPIGCGKFMITHAETENNFILTHMVSNPLKELDDYFYSIFPSAGEVWAVFKDQNIAKKDELEYQIVEIVQKNDNSIDVALLVRVEGFKSLFRRRSGLGIKVVFKIPSDEFYRFSHKIPSYGTNQNFGRQLGGAIILDPFLVPKKDGEIFSIGDPFPLERSKANPLWSGIHYIVDKQRNGISLFSQEHVCIKKEKEEMEHNPKFSHNGI